MKNKERYIKDCEEKLKETEALVNEKYLSIAEIVCAFPEEKTNGSIAEEVILKIRDIDKEIIDNQKKIEEILTKIEKADEIESLRKRLNEEIKTIEKDKISNYETIGRAAYKAYKDGTLSNDKYLMIFSDIIKLSEKIEKTEIELKRLSAMAGGSKAVVRIKSKTKIIYLNNCIKSYSSQLNRSYKKAGENICRTELITDLETQSIEDTVQPYKQSLEGIKKLEQEELLLADQNTKIKDDLEKLGAQKSPLKKIETIENHINDLYELKKSNQIETGRLIYDIKREDICKEKEITEIIAEVDGFKTIITELEADIENTLIDIEIDKKNKIIEETNKKIEENNTKIKNINKKNEELKEILLEAEAEIKKMRNSDNTKNRV